MRAFTLIEMMVTVSLIAIISAFTVINLNFQRQERQVEQVTRELYGTLLYARNLAVSGKVFKDQSLDGVADVPNGYGLFILLLDSDFDSFEYFIYGDSSYLGGNYGVFDWVAEEIMDSSQVDIFNGGIKLNFDIDGTVVTAQGSEINYFFSTPRGESSFYLNFAEQFAETITLTVSSVKDPLIQKSIVFKPKTGQIYVVD